MICDISEDCVDLSAKLFDVRGDVKLRSVVSSTASSCVKQLGWRITTAYKRPIPFSSAASTITIVLISLPLRFALSIHRDSTMDVEVDPDLIFAGTQTTSANTPSSPPPAATSPLNASLNTLLETMDAPHRPSPHPSTRSSTSALQQAPITLATPTEPSPPSITRLTPFAASFLALPPEILTHILLYLAPDDLGILSRLIPPLAGVERDRYLWAVWVHSVSCARCFCAALRRGVQCPPKWPIFSTPSLS